MPVAYFRTPPRLWRAIDLVSRVPGGVVEPLALTDRVFLSARKHKSMKSNDCCQRLIFAVCVLKFQFASFVQRWVLVQELNQRRALGGYTST